MVEKLTKKQQLFIEEYFKCNMNATEAAFKVYASKKRETAAVIGSENLKKPKIADEIQRRIDEHAMSANEVLYRLADHARASFDVFLNDYGNITFSSISDAVENGYGHLIKKLSVRPTKEGVAISLELHDPQSALVHLGRHHKLFTNEVELGDKTLRALTNDDLQGLSDAELAAIATGSTASSSK